MKRYFGYAQAEQDIERIADLLRRHGAKHGGSLRWGAIAGMRPVKTDSGKSPRKVVDEIAGKIKAKHAHLITRADYKSARLDSPLVDEEETFFGYDAYAILMTSKRR